MKSNVSFEVAKLLKEKGFDRHADAWWAEYTSHYGKDSKHITIEFDDSNRWNEQYRFLCYAPTFQTAMSWLREVHDQHIVVFAYNNVALLKTQYYSEIQNLREPTEKGFCVNGCTVKDSYEEACEAAIEYCLKELI